MNVAITHNPPFEGQYGDLPFQDPWWKTLLAVLAIILFIAAVVVAIVYGAPFVAAVGGAIVIGGTLTCCTVPFFVAIGLTAAAAGSAVVSALSDIRDPFRRGQDNTLPGENESTISESLDVDFDYIEPIALGKPYSINTKWKYTRTTKDELLTDHEYSYSVEETNNNIHCLSKYEIEAPDVVKIHLQKEKPFIIKTKFYDNKEMIFTGDQLFVKCFLQRKSDNKIISFVLEDNGNNPDVKANDGVYTASYFFNESEEGLWKIYVIAQDTNNANESLTPEEAAQIIGGQVLTNQLTINFSGGTCPFVPDGYVNVTY